MWTLRWHGLHSATVLPGSRRFISRRPPLSTPHPPRVGARQEVVSGEGPLADSPGTQLASAVHACIEVLIVWHHATGLYGPRRRAPGFTRVPEVRFGALNFFFRAALAVPLG